MNIKELKKLAKACRVAGIKSFKSPEFEFTLNEEEPAKFSGTKQKQFHQDDGQVNTDGLSEEELLFYSVRNPEDAATEGN